VFTLTAGNFGVVEAKVHPDPQATDDCNALGAVRAARWVLEKPVDAANTAMLLNTQHLGFGVRMVGNVVQMRGEIQWQEGDEFWGGGVVLTGDDSFVMGLTYVLNNSAGFCRSDLAVTFRHR